MGLGPWCLLRCLRRGRPAAAAQRGKRRSVARAREVGRLQSDNPRQDASLTVSSPETG